MVNTLNGNARGLHVSPGVYARETEITPTVKSLGITTLGVVGETVKGPAFQPISISNWTDFQNVFGGTNPEKFKGSQYPKYELPYIAKSYLEQSNQLYVCRTLGLSGFNAGPAWVVTLNCKDNNKMAVAVLRSRGNYEKYFKYDGINSESGSCECNTRSYDVLTYKVGEQNPVGCSIPKGYNASALHVGQYIPLQDDGNQCTNYQTTKGNGDWTVSGSNYGKLKLFGWTGRHDNATLSKYYTGVTSSTTADEVATTVGRNNSDYFEYAVTLNPNDRDYILKVLGTSVDDGDAPIYVESLYDVALEGQINNNNAVSIANRLEFYQVYSPSDYCDFQPITNFMYMQEAQLGRKNVGERYVATKSNVVGGYRCHQFDYKTGRPVDYTVSEEVKVGQIYTVAQFTDVNKKRHYFYRYYALTDAEIINMALSGKNDCVPIIDKLGSESELTGSTNNTLAEQMALPTRTAVKNNADGHYYRLNGSGDTLDVEIVKIDFNNYKSAYRYASTPWIVSNVHSDFKHIEVNKLFRFHTISDGNSSNYQVKVSIANIKPDDGTFDVIVRNINDTDGEIVSLEKFTKCSLVPGTSNYLGLKIGTYDGNYESKSNYITVEINENSITQNAIPAGFLGYPAQDFGGLPLKGSKKTGLVGPNILYNCEFDEDIKHRRQYFGLSDVTGVDIDALTYKGESSYYDDPQFMTQGFHLDSRMDLSAYGNSSEEQPIITVDGETGYVFDAVSNNARTDLFNEKPIIDKEVEMNGSIYEYVDLRKFTVYFYGGFDGWDVFRDERSIGDDFKLTKYRGTYSKVSGEGISVDKINDPESLGLNQEGITSDWYAYLSAIRQFSNPEAVSINVLATPGIDYVNNQTLVSEVIDMVEEERGDCLYITTTPDKPLGALDYVDEMYTADDAADNMLNSEINSTYTATYYPWCKYYDESNNKYIFLPATRDVVRNIALTDNISFPWYAVAGYGRGEVNCDKAHVVTKLEDEDTLYNSAINPIKSFADDGVKIWGNKVMSIEGDEHLTNRINVRRLMLRIKKLIKDAGKKLTFDPDDATLGNTFKSKITPILDNIKLNRGLYDYYIEVDNSVEARERLELNSKIFVKPTKAMEYMNIDFIITPESVSFTNA